MLSPDYIKESVLRSGGVVSLPMHTLRDMLGAQRLGRYVVRRIRHELSFYGLMLVATDDESLDGDATVLVIDPTTLAGMAVNAVTQRDSVTLSAIIYADRESASIG